MGTASAVFNGINHSRLEYMLLQCSIINLLPKFNLGKEQFAIASKVKLDGKNNQFSSGEELLKCWSILGSIGHPKYTYGVERSLLSCLRRNPKARKLILSMIHQNDLKKWSINVIDNYQDFNFHWILSLLRLSQHLPSKSRHKSLLIRCMKNLLLPLKDLKFQSHADLYKIYRLRKIFKKIRLLSLVTLDSYYSHHPVRYQLSTTIMDLENLFSDQETDFERLLNQTAGWLADELYMHSSAAATLRYYEIRSAMKLNKNLSKWFGSTEEFQGLMNNFMNSGFGQPSNNRLQPFMRISLSEQQASIFENKDTYDIRNTLQRGMSKPSNTQISVLKNSFTRFLHIDLLYDHNNSTPMDIGKLCCGFYAWFNRKIQHQVNSRLDSLLPELEDITVPDSAREVYRDILMRQSVEEWLDTFSTIISRLVDYLIPENLTGSIVEFIPSSKSVNGFLFALKNSELKTGDVNEVISQSINHGPYSHNQDRIQELKAIDYVVRYSRFPFLIACAEKFILRNSEGKHVAEWDGLLLEISGRNVRLNIIEAKNKSTDHQNEQEAYKQLLKYRDLIKSKHKRIGTRRVKIPGLGAKLQISLC